MSNPNLTLTLSVDQINTVLNHLGRGAFGDVADLIFSIKDQANAQLAAQNGAPAEKQSQAETDTASA